ncbi:MAG: hypothetical protein PHG23_02645 [Candidatus Pacebacteria bacterium]|nr:hypothetical protein [Candidatus Paceibacterota bacterium]
MDTKQLSPTILISIFFILASGAFVYFLVMPIYSDAQTKQFNIKTLQAQLDAQIVYNTQLSQTEKTLQDLNWGDKRKKIEANFSTSPFFESEAEIFLRDVVKRSGMALTQITLSAPTSVKSANQNQAEGTALKDAKPAGQGTAGAQTYADDAALNSLEGEVRKTEVTMTVRGTYDMFNNLLKIFEKQGYIIAVKQVSFTGGTATTDFKITANIYSY